MVIVKLMGGLGNQLFQYAAAKKIAINNKTELVIDSNTGFVNDPFKREYSLNKFNIDSKTLNYNLIYLKLIEFPFINYVLNILIKVFSINRLHLRESQDYCFDEKIIKFKSKKNIYLEGYFQSEKYFKDIEKEILTLFEFKIKFSAKVLNLLDKINNSESVSIHLREYDEMFKNKTENIYDFNRKQYYEKAILKIKKKINNPVFFIFSDNIKWAKNLINLQGFEVSYVSDRKSLTQFDDLFLIKSCKHNIIANSSFSWWGAWLNLNPNKIIISPKVWFQSNRYSYRDVVPVNWLKV